MNYDTFLKEKERVENLPEPEQKDFYAGILEEECHESSVRLLAYFEYAKLFYFDGDFRKAREILEPFAISYQSYEYIPEMIACFNLMGVASQCEGEYILSRYFYTVALKIVKEQNALHYYAYEYNNISLTYIAEQNYEVAFQYIQKAEQWLSHSDKKMGAYVYLNKSDIFNHLGQLDNAVTAFETCIQNYDGFGFLPDDTLICGMALYYKLGDKAKYREYMQKILDKLEDMYASEFIDACKVVFNCSLDAGNYPLVEQIIEKMDTYIHTHPQENKVGLQIEQLKYIYAKKIGDQSAMLTALEKKDHYYQLIVSTLEEQRAISMDEYLETHKHLQEAVQNEMQANHAKTQFLANMSHDIRTPMNAIMGITNLMEHSLYNPDKLENYLSKIQLSSRHMLGLINDLLDMTKIESGTTHLHEEPVKFAEQIIQIQDIIRPQISERGQKFRLHTSHICHENLIADAVRIRQILLNILSNSVKYTPEGGTISFDIEELPPKDPGKASYRFTITDTGIGMDEELLSHVFEPFRRGEDSMINKIQGTGLGMSISKNLVELMGGTIHIDSEINKGTCTTILLEFTIDQKEDSKTEPLKLLLLSKNKEFTEDLSASVKTKPLFLICTSNEEEAYKVLSMCPIDVILLSDSFCHTSTIAKLREASGEAALYLALEPAPENEVQIFGFKPDSSKGYPVSDLTLTQLKQKGIHGKIPYPFFFTSLEKEVNRIRSSNTSRSANDSILDGMHFLCAEDNELNAEILCASLNIAGASCKVYPDGDQLVDAFEHVLPGQYDAILMDIQMPNMNGYEATRRIRHGQNPLGQTIPIIAMTANAFVEDVHNSLAAGMNAHISKPLEMADLERAMRRLKNKGLPH